MDNSIYHMDQRFEELLAYSLRHKVTDIHFEISNNQVRIFMRTIQGIQEVTSHRNDLQLVNYLQYKAHLDLTSYQPQSGSFHYFFRKQYYSFRLAVIVAVNRKDAVLRILDCQQGLKINQITFQSDMQQLMMKLIDKRSGLVLFSGLTGSGKTTTMYSLIQLMKGRSVYSIEDPIEVNLENIVQLEINRKTGFDYDEAIRQVLRHNPDVLMIGEIRDQETAKMAFRAALTGCLVFTSIHGMSCSGTLNRLMELGVNRQDIREVVIGVFNQRLCKRYQENRYICIFDYADSLKVNSYLEKRVEINSMEKIIEDAVRNQFIDPQYLYE